MAISRLLRDRSTRDDTSAEPSSGLGRASLCSWQRLQPVPSRQFSPSIRSVKLGDVVKLTHLVTRRSRSMISVAGVHANHRGYISSLAIRSPRAQAAIAEAIDLTLRQY